MTSRSRTSWAIKPIAMNKTGSRRWKQAAYQQLDNGQATVDGTLVKGYLIVWMDLGWANINEESEEARLRSTKHGNNLNSSKDGGWTGLPTCIMRWVDMKVRETGHGYQDKRSHLRPKELAESVWRRIRLAQKNLVSTKSEKNQYRLTEVRGALFYKLEQ